jgi:toluene monooxygenase system protein B
MGAQEETWGKERMMMAVLPITAAHHDDFVVLVIPIEDTDTMAQVAEKVAAHTVGVRVTPREAPLRVRYKGQVEPDHVTVAEVGIGPMDFIEVFYHE